MTFPKPPELIPLLALSARVGFNPLLTQGCSGNTSIKIGAQLWIKGSGKWLANALVEDIFLPIDLLRAKACLNREDGADFYACSTLHDLKPSVETAMHMVLPHRVVAHVHSVGTIAKAIRSDAAMHLKSQLDGLRWGWVPYVSSGLPLAHAIRDLLEATPRLDVLVLGNHGLVVGGDDCQAVEYLLDEVEARLRVTPRQAPCVHGSWLKDFAPSSEWRAAEQTQVHALATDVISRAILSQGTLYPCQAIFLGGADPWRSIGSGPNATLDDPQNVALPFRVICDRGVLISSSITDVELQTLIGLAEVVQRVDKSAPVRYLTQSELDAMSALGAYREATIGHHNPAVRICV
jgi:rhamnose utilization protein RhaD (predicted bifunctional aldolase and dehydrogenase)